MDLRKVTTLAIVAFLSVEVLATQALPVNAESQLSSTVEVASVIQRPSRTEAVEQDIPATNMMMQPTESDPEQQDIIEEPAVTDAVETVEPTQYLIQREDGSPILIKVTSSWDSEASVYVNDMEAIRFRSDAGGVKAYERARIVAERLYQALNEDPNAADKIKPAMIKRFAVIQLGDTVLATADRETAKATGLKPIRLAYVWTNRLRESLERSPLAESEYEKILSALAKDNYHPTGKVQSGMASWYGPGFHGRRTASGTRYNMYEMTAAHKTLPFGTLVKVFNHRNKKSCVVKITDRGPYAHGRIIDLSKGAAQAIGLSGVARVTIEVVRPQS